MDTVAELMSRTVHTVDAGANLDDVVSTMVKHDIGSVVVTKGGKLFGIVTERDLVRHIGKKGWKGRAPTAGELASAPMVTVPPEEEVWVAFALMLQKGIRRLPVVQSGRLIGIVTERDLFKWVVRVVYEPNIPEKIRALLRQNP